MTSDARLVIRLTPGPLRPRVGDARINEVRGGPETLLRWLETQLGLPSPPIHIANRITEYATALDTVTNSAITASMKTDRWATASALSRDETSCFWRDGTEWIVRRCPTSSGTLHAPQRDAPLCSPAKQSGCGTCSMPSTLGRLYRLTNACCRIRPMRGRQSGVPSSTVSTSSLYHRSHRTLVRALPWKPRSDSCGAGRSRCSGRMPPSATSGRVVSRRRLSSSPQPSRKLRAN